MYESFLLGRTIGGIVALYPLSLVCKRLYAQYKDLHSSSPRTRNQSHRDSALVKITASKKRQIEFTIVEQSMTCKLESTLDIFVYTKNNMINLQVWMEEPTLYRSTYIVSGDGAGGVAGDKLELHVDSAEEIFSFGLKPRARDLVERKSEEVSTIEYLSSMITPS